MAENTRELVLDTLLTLEREKTFSHSLVKAVLDKYDYLDGRDKAFYKRVAEGTLERQIELDYYLNHFSNVPVKKMKPLIRCLLRMSVYQLLYMDAVPDSAVCNEACKLALKRKFQNLRGYVNGVLRNVARNKENLPLPDKSKDLLQYLSVKYSMPMWLVELWHDRYGAGITEEMLSGLMQVHPVSLRFSTKLSATEREQWCEQMRARGAELAQNMYLPYVYLMQNGEGLNTMPGFAEGIYLVQDVSSALAVEAAGITPTDFVVDVCAAPGGKSILASEKAAKVLSRDVSEEKTTIIKENLHRMQCTNVEVQVYDGSQQDVSLAGKADVVLLDVPCSGLGIIGKKRDIKYNASPEGIAELNALQKEIVRASAGYVKSGGILMYSTCTIHKSENEDMVRFISEELGFEPVSLKECIPDTVWSAKERIAEAMAIVGKDTSSGLSKMQQDACVQLLPGFMESDGFFMAKFRNNKKHE